VASVTLRVEVVTVGAASASFRMATITLRLQPVSCRTVPGALGVESGPFRGRSVAVRVAFDPAGDRLDALRVIS